MEGGRIAVYRITGFSSAPIAPVHRRDAPSAHLVGCGAASTTTHTHRGARCQRESSPPFVPAACPICQPRARARTRATRVAFVYSLASSRQPSRLLTSSRPTQPEPPSRLLPAPSLSRRRRRCSRHQCLFFQFLIPPFLEIKREPMYGSVLSRVSRYRWATGESHTLALPICLPIRSPSISFLFDFPVCCVVCVYVRVRVCTYIRVMYIYIYIYV